MIDRAANWFQVYKHSAGVHSWEHFVISVSREFEENTHRVKTKELLHLKQSGSVLEYKQQFDQLVYHIRLYDHNISETMLVSQFLLGLREDLRTSVEMHLPKIVSQAATLAEIQDHLSGKIKHQPRKFPTHKSDNKPSFSNTEVWKARQLKEYRRVNNLCFKCGDKYTPTHTCATANATLNALDQQTFDGGGFMSEELLETP
jgi:hypothetical protein